MEQQLNLVCKKHVLDVGKYIVFSKIRFSKKPSNDEEVTLAVYGDHPCKIKDASP